MSGWVNRRILIVDDNADIHDDFRKILQGSQKRRSRKYLEDIENQLFSSDSDIELPEPLNSDHEVEYRIDSAYQGKEALHMVSQAHDENRPYALVFMDVRMPPGMDGIETISRIWDEYPNVEIVICTAYADYSFEEILEKLGSTDRLLFLNKPFDSIVVKQMALSLTRKWTLHAEAQRHVLRLKEEIAQRRESEQRLHHLIHHDALTGLFNRNQLQISLEEAINAARERNTRFSLFFLDMDRFKEINDTLGYQNGDHILQQIARRLKNEFLETGTVFRQGGDEFAILVPEISSVDQTAKIAECIQKLFEPHFTLDNISIEAQPSIGIVIYPDHGCNTDMLMRHADMTLITAKKIGQGFQFYQEQMNLYSPQRLLLLSELRQAITYDDLLLYFQPRVDLGSNRVIGVEAAVRWPHYLYGFIPPEQFIPLAERCGIIKHLTAWVLKEIPRQWAAWKALGLDLCISMNISGQDLLDSLFPEKVATQIAEFDMPASRLMIEISEKGVTEDPNQARHLLQTLVDMGIRVAIDNFGTGHSSLAQLKTLPVSEIKIDPSFLQEFSHHHSDKAIVHSMIDLGHNLGLSVTAEGVSAEPELGLLTELGCDYVQGKAINIPVPSGELTLWLRHTTWKIETSDLGLSAQPGPANP